MKIKYNEIERILGDYLISYKGRIHRTKENLQTFPDIVTFVDNGLSEDEYAELIQEEIMLFNMR
jgi:hypothetical protein